MKFAIQYTAILLTAAILILHCLPLTASGRESRRTNTDPIPSDCVMEAESIVINLPETGDGFLTRLKLTGLSVITSASALILLNHRKRT